MAFEIVSRLKQLFEGDPSVRKVADDPALSAEILLLFRMVLADGEVQEAELAKLRRICRDTFGIEEDGFRRVVGFLQDYGYETTAAQALDSFRELPRDRRIQLARHMAEVAKSDDDLSRQEVGFLARALEILDVNPHEVVPARP